MRYPWWLLGLAACASPVNGDFKAAAEQGVLDQGPPADQRVDVGDGPPMDQDAPVDLAAPRPDRAVPDAAPDDGGPPEPDRGTPESDEGPPEGDMCVAGDEGCNGLDDDCDGQVDEGLPLNGCGTCGEVPVETCNGADDDCDGEVDERFDLQTDPAHCGACGAACAVPNADNRCAAGQCVLAACEPGWAGPDCARMVVGEVAFVAPVTGPPAEPPEPLFERLSDALAAVPAGAEVVLLPGRHETGPVTVGAPDIRIRGEGEAVVVGTQPGAAVLTVAASGVTLEGFTVTSEALVHALVAARAEGGLVDVAVVDVTLRDATLSAPALPDEVAAGLLMEGVQRARVVGVLVEDLALPGPGQGERQVFLAGVRLRGSAGVVADAWVGSLDGRPVPVDLQFEQGQVGVAGYWVLGGGDVRLLGNQAGGLQGSASWPDAGWVWGLLCSDAQRCEIRGNQVVGLQGGTAGGGGPALGVVVTGPGERLVADNTVFGLRGGSVGGWAVGVWVRSGGATVRDNQIGRFFDQPCEEPVHGLVSAARAQAEARPRAVGIMLGDDYFQAVGPAEDSQVQGNRIGCVYTRGGDQDGRAIGILALGGGAHTLTDNEITDLEGRHPNGITLVDTQGTVARTLIAGLRGTDDVYGLWSRGRRLDAHTLTITDLQPGPEGQALGMDILSDQGALHSSVVRGVPGVGVRVAEGSTFAVDHTLFWAVDPLFEGLEGGLAPELGNAVADPRHRDPGRGDYRLRPDSPAIDGGRPGAALCGDEPGGLTCRLDQGHQGGTAEGQVRAQ